MKSLLRTSFSCSKKKKIWLHGIYTEDLVHVVLKSCDNNSRN